MSSSYVIYLSIKRRAGVVREMHDRTYDSEANMIDLDRIDLSLSKLLLADDTSLMTASVEQLQ